MTTNTNANTNTKQIQIWETNIRCVWSDEIIRKLFIEIRMKISIRACSGKLKLCKLLIILPLCNYHRNVGMLSRS